MSLFYIGPDTTHFLTKKYEYFLYLSYISAQKHVVGTH